MAFEPESTRRQGGMTGESIGGAGHEYGEEGRMHEAREKTREVMHEARERTSEVMSRAGDRARTQFESQKTRAAHSLSAVAEALRDSGQQLRDRNEAGVAPVMDRAADGVDRLSSFLNSRNVDDMMRDVQTFARRRPEVFLGAFFTLGVLAARFMKAGRHEPGVDRHGYGYVHGTEGARLPEVRDTSRGTSSFGYEQSRGYSQGSPFSETGGTFTGTSGPSVPYSQPSHGYSAGGTTGSGRMGEGTGQRESPGETGAERERGGSSDRESDRFER